MMRRVALREIAERPQLEIAQIDPDTGWRFMTPTTQEPQSPVLPESLQPQLQPPTGQWWRSRLWWRRLREKGPEALRE